MITKLKNRIGMKINKMARSFLTSDEMELLKLGAYVREWVVPRNLPVEDTEKFIPSTWFADDFNLNIENQRLMLKDWQKYTSFYDQLRADPIINKEFLGKPYLHNSYYPTPDAEIYASMILDNKPAQIVEIGSGFSTLIARKAILWAGLDTTISSIDPAPRSDVRNAATRLTLKYVEDIDFDELGIAENTLFFVDSSHICRGRGDVPFLFCNVIPRLPAGSLIHVHDIFLPYEYPTVFLDRMYTEQYLLYALLMNSARYEIVFTTHYMTRKYPQEMQSVFGAIVGSNNRFFGSSFWFRVK